MTDQTIISIQNVIKSLLDEENPLPPRYLYRLSDLTPDDLAALKQAWSKVPDLRRQAIMEDLEQLGDSDLLVSFESIGRLAMHDTDAIVRALAIRLLWDYESLDLVQDFLHLMQTDPHSEVRAATASALGAYIYQGELEELPAKLLHEIEDHLLNTIAADPEAVVRRRVLEALGFSSRSEVPPLIQAAFESNDKEWKVSALFAMGRSADERWKDLTLETLNHKSAALRAEAARASGELEIFEAVPRLIELAEDGDGDVRQAAIWSLSQIGGEGVRETLQQLLEESEDDGDLDLLEDALDNLAFTEDMQLFTVFDMPDKPERLMSNKPRRNGGDVYEEEGAIDEDYEDLEDFAEEEDEDSDDEQGFDEGLVAEIGGEAFGEEGDFDLMDDDKYDLDTDEDDDEDL